MGTETQDDEKSKVVLSKQDELDVSEDWLII